MVKMQIVVVHAHVCNKCADLLESRECKNRINVFETLCNENTNKAKYHATICDAIKLIRSMHAWKLHWNTNEREKKSFCIFVCIFDWRLFATRSISIELNWIGLFGVLVFFVFRSYQFSLQIYLIRDEAVWHNEINLNEYLRIGINTHTERKRTK